MTLDLECHGRNDSANSECHADRCALRTVAVPIHGIVADVGGRLINLRPAGWRGDRVAKIVLDYDNDSIAINNARWQVDRLRRDTAASINSLRIGRRANAGSYGGGRHGDGQAPVVAAARIGEAARILARRIDHLGGDGGGAVTTANVVTETETGIAGRVAGQRAAGVVAMHRRQDQALGRAP